MAGDLLTAAWPVADVYCMMNAVLPDLLPPVVARLEVQARARRIIVASVSTSNAAFAGTAWLRELSIRAEGPAVRELRMWESISAESTTGLARARCVLRGSPLEGASG